MKINWIDVETNLDEGTVFCCHSTRYHANCLNPRMHLVPSFQFRYLLSKNFSRFVRFSNVRGSISRIVLLYIDSSSNIISPLNAPGSILTSPQCFQLRRSAGKETVLP
jgi:hypothetical protein